MGGDGQSRLWYPLYKAVKVLGVSPSAVSSVVGSGSSESAHNRIVAVETRATDEYTVTVVRCANSGLILRFVGNASEYLRITGKARHPSGGIVRASSHFSDRNIQIASTALNTEGTTLLVACHDGSIYTVPVSALLFPSLPGQGIDHPSVPSLLTFLKPPESHANEVAAKKEIVKVFCLELQRTKGRDQVSVGALVGAVWWRGVRGGDCAVCACSGGFVVVVDLEAKVERRCIPIPLRPHALHLSQDTSATYLLLRGRRGMGDTDLTEHFCAILLEHRETPGEPWHDITQPHDVQTAPHTPVPPAVSLPPYEPVALPPLNAGDDQGQIWAGPLGRGKDGIVSFRPASQEVMCYPASITAGAMWNPLYAYHVGPGATHVHMTSGTILYAHVHNGHQKVAVLSRYAATAVAKSRARLGLDTSVLQELLLPYERVQGFASSGRCPHSYDSLPAEGVLVWTDCSVYELQPDGRPEDLFKATLLYGVREQEDTAANRLLHHAESLAKAFQLDIVALYEEVAHVCRSRNMKWALQLYKRVDMRPLDYLKRLTKYGNQDDVLKHVATYIKLGYQGLNTALFYSAMQSILCVPRFAQLSAPRPELAQSLSRMSEISLESDDNASRSCSSVKSVTGRHAGLRGLDAGRSRGVGFAPSTRASAHATAASANDASTAKTYDDDTIIDTTHLQLADNEPVPDPILALSTAIAATDPADATHIIATLCTAGMVERALLLADTEALIPQTLQLLLDQGCYRLPPASIERIASTHAATILGHTPFLSALSNHSRLLLTTSAVASGSLSYLPEIGPLVMTCTKAALLRRTFVSLSEVAVEQAVLALLRLAEVTEMKGNVQAADDVDQEACDLLKGKEWGTFMRRHATATGRLRVVSEAALVEGDHSAAVVYFLMWLQRRYGGDTHSDTHDNHDRMASLSADLLHTVLTEAVDSTVRRRVLRITLAFYQALQLSSAHLVDTLKDVDAAEDMREVLLRTPSLTEVLPVSYRLALMRDQLGTDQVAAEVREYEQMSRAIPIPGDILKQAKASGKDTIFFTCGHAPMAVAKYVKKIADIQEGGCPVTSSVLKHVAKQVAEGTCRVLPQGCPKCMTEQLPKSMTRALLDKTADGVEKSGGSFPAGETGLMAQRRKK